MFPVSRALSRSPHRLHLADPLIRGFSQKGNDREDACATSEHSKGANRHRLRALNLGDEYGGHALTLTNPGGKVAF